MTGMSDLKTELSVMLADVQNAVTGTTVDLNSIENRLGYLYQQHQQVGDAQACEQITAAWTDVQRMAEHNALLTTHVAAVTKVASTAIQQRDVALDNLDTARTRAEKAEDELTDLNSAIDEVYNEGSTGHPRLMDIVDVIQDHIYDSGLHLECPGCAACEEGWFDNLDHDAVNWLAKALFGGYADELPTEVREQVAEWVNAAGDLIRETIEQQEAAARVDLEAEPESTESW